MKKNSTASNKSHHTSLMEDSLGESIRFVKRGTNSRKPLRPADIETRVLAQSNKKRCVVKFESCTGELPLLLLTDFPEKSIGRTRS